MLCRKFAGSSRRGGKCFVGFPCSWAAVAKVLVRREWFVERVCLGAIGVEENGL